MRPLNFLVLLAFVVSLTPAPALAADRVEFFDLDGRRTGYAVVDHETGRVDFYDVNSRRTGWGRVMSSGKAEVFDLQGTRQGETALPIGKEAEERRR
ncbi:MAG: hypothetical protein ACE5MK_12405 [Acidobacteriota bacterium]